MIPAVHDAWPDVERLVVSWLSQQLPGVRVRTETTTQLDNELPTVRIHRIPGGYSDGISEEAVVDTEVFAATRPDMWSVASKVNAAMLHLATHAAADGYVDAVEVDSTPGEVPYGNPAIRRAIATYRLTTRAQTRA